MTDCIFSKKLATPEMLWVLSSPGTEATEGDLKLLVGLIVKCVLKSGVVDCHIKYEVYCHLGCCCSLDTISLC